MLEDLEMEPSDLGDLMLSLEQEFGIEWTDDDLQGIRTVGDLTAFVENQE
jgi:acyl carrier protein